MEKLILVTASGLAREVLASVRATGDFDVVGFVDDDPRLQGGSVAGVPVIGTVADAAAPDARLLICAGPGAVRAAIASRLAGLGVRAERYATHVHASVSVGTGCAIGAGSILLAGSVLTTDVCVARHVVLMPRVTLTHDDTVADFATFAAGATLGGGVHVGRAAYLGMNSCVRQDLAVGAGAVLGMGAVLLRDLPADQTWAGNPAGPIHRRTGVHLPNNTPERQPELAAHHGGNMS